MPEKKIPFLPCPPGTGLRGTQVEITRQLEGPRGAGPGAGGVRPAGREEVTTIKTTFLGGADEVGASSLLLEIGGKRLLVDAGIRPSPKASWGLAGDQFTDLSQIDQAGGPDVILVTHAHTDHTGALELVTGRFPGVPVYATPPTIALDPRPAPGLAPHHADPPR